MCQDSGSGAALELTTGSWLGARALGPGPASMGSTRATSLATAPVPGQEKQFWTAPPTLTRYSPCRGSADMDGARAKLPYASFCTRIPSGGVRTVTLCELTAIAT